MKYNPDKHNRRSTRLPGWDYSAQGIYFITIGSYEMECIWGDVVEKKMVLNDLGKLVKEKWERSFEIRKEINSPCWVIMPNHIHALIHLRTEDGAQRGYLPENRGKKILRPKSLSSFVGGFKSNISALLGYSIWHRNFHDHLIRNQAEFDFIEKYIVNNPANWDKDELNPKNLPKKLNFNPFKSSQN